LNDTDLGGLLVPLSNVSNICNPFKVCCWPIFGGPITQLEISECVLKGKLNDPISGDCESRSDHVGRVAWFVVNGWIHPIQIDVGVPSLGCNVQWIVVDGNHRLAAAIYSEYPNIKCACSGSIDTISMLVSGKWHRCLGG
jgi:hypothetical protein